MSNTIIKSFGIITTALNLSQNNCSLTNNLNMLLNEYYTYCPIVFYQNLAKSPIIPKFCQLQQQLAWGYKHTLISTDMETTNILINCINAKRKYFYVYDLEWIIQPNLNFQTLSYIYQNPTINLIARSQSHFDILKKIWKEPIAIIEDWNYKQLIRLIDNDI